MRNATSSAAVLFACARVALAQCECEPPFLCVPAFRVEGTWVNPCAVSPCGTGCTPGAVHSGAGSAQIRWGTPVSGSFPSSAGFAGTIVTDLLPGAEFHLGTVTFANGVIENGTGLGSVWLSARAVPLDPTCGGGRLIAVSTPALCIINTPNTTGDPVLDADIHMFSGMFDAILVPEESARSGVEIWGSLRVVETFTDGPTRGEPTPMFALDLTRLANPSGGAEIVVNVPIEIDFLPESCPNRFRVDDPNTIDARLRTRVVIAASEHLDVRDIDPNSLELVTPTGLTVAPESVGLADLVSPWYRQDPCECERNLGDRHADLLLKFSRRRIAEALLPYADQGTIAVAVRGRLFDGAYFQGTDCTVVASPHVLPGTPFPEPERP